MRNKAQIHDALSKRITSQIKQNIRTGGILDLINYAVAEEMEDAYSTIERNKNPYIYTNMDSNDLDNTGFFVNVPRQKDESDEDYLYRMMHWTQLKAASNETAINDSLLNMHYASDCHYYPATHGAGTASIYVIPKEYTNETIANALKEAKNRVSSVIAKDSIVEYIIPQITPVIPVIKLAAENANIKILQDTLGSQIKQYINSIPPNEYLTLNTINKIGLKNPNVNYFNVIMLYIDNEPIYDFKILQKLNKKFLLQSIAWEVEGDNK